jgi:protein phosphatase
VPLRIQVAGRTDKGLVRSGNEDYLHLDEANHVYAVCDGMGGHQAGEVASMMAGETLRDVFGQFQSELVDPSELDVGRTLPGSSMLLLKSIRLANRAIYTMAAQDTSKSGMGTTVVATAFESDILTVAHVGDSRAYRLTENEIIPLTRDHSWVEELQESQQVSREEASSLVGKNVITRALGVRENVEVDYRILKTEPGETYMLCSDGLCGFADDDEIFDVARRSLNDIDKLAENLIQMANDRGGADNVTVIVLRVLEVKESPLPEAEVETLTAERPELLKFEDEWILKIRQRREEESIRAPAESAGPKRSLLIGLFVVFIVVAALIIYFSQYN